MRGGKTDAAALEKHREDLKTKLDGFERIFAKQDYLGGKVRNLVLISARQLRRTFLTINEP